MGGRGTHVPESSLRQSTRPPVAVRERSGVRAKTIDEWAPPKKRERRPPTVPHGRRVRFTEEAGRMSASGDYAELQPGHAVALYAACHSKVYGVHAAELDGGREFALASYAAGRLMKRELGGDPSEMASFIRWTWLREEGRERWRRQNDKEGGRLSWRLQFSAALVSDYRLDARRKR